MTATHHPDDLIRLFNHCFQENYHTQLAYGGEEPVYLPATAAQPYHTIYFAHGYFSSALHECAHWFLAGTARRALVDYGYWYVPDGRNAEQQALFQKVEVKPQALEWMLAKACDYPFRLSFDNLNGPSFEYEAFHAAVQQQVLDYERNGLPPRAQIFHQALLSCYERLEMT
ncbi:MAG: elongation factor P hydroxylase [Legionellales bacterium]|nr:elongation factor P hydroxylase [Legionellales bacterium]